MTEIRIVGAEEWRESLFGCCSDLSTCCFGCFCTACLFGENVKNTTKETGFCTGCCGYFFTQAGCCCFVHKPARIRFREAYGLKEGHGLASDLCAAWCCSACGVCQEAREIKARGNPPMIKVVGVPVINQPRGANPPVVGVIASKPR